MDHAILQKKNIQLAAPQTTERSGEASAWCFLGRTSKCHGVTSGTTSRGAQWREGSPLHLTGAQILSSRSVEIKKRMKFYG